MNHYYITGTSSGIGKALAEELLKESGHTVHGLARRQTIDHQNYKHTSLDLGQQEAVLNFEFGQHPDDCELIVLVNNAGTLGEMAYLGEMPDADIAASLNVNLVAPALLTNKFLQRYAQHPARKVIINITSGAATSPYDGWSIYCTSKAGIDMLTRVAVNERQQRSDSRTHILAVAPGVVDTEMQNQIRSTGEDKFSRVEKFHQLKQNNQLYKPADVATALANIIHNPTRVADIVSRISL